MTEEFFKNRLAAAKWLESEGYPVKRSKFYEDCDAGKVPVNADKTLSSFAVAQYGAAQLKANAGASNFDVVEAAEADLKKKKAEASIAAMKSARMAREEDAFWLPADEAWAAVAALVIQIKSAVRYGLYSKRREIVHAAAGHQDRADELFAFLDALLDDAMNEVAGQEIKIEFSK
jgi:hypothetical protein